MVKVSGATNTLAVKVILVTATLLYVVINQFHVYFVGCCSFSTMIWRTASKVAKVWNSLLKKGHCWLIDWLIDSCCKWVHHTVIRVYSPQWKGFHCWASLVLLHILYYWRTLLQIPVAERSKARICGRTLAGNVGSNLAGGMDICLLWVSCLVR